ncbi:MAG: hypothetical protein ACKO23_15350, partial [Gemmataceae bacterium]
MLQISWLIRIPTEIIIRQRLLSLSSSVFHIQKNEFPKKNGTNGIRHPFQEIGNVRGSAILPGLLELVTGRIDDPLGIERQVIEGDLRIEGLCHGFGFFGISFATPPLR